MRTMTATEASRKFSDLLDAIERGEIVTITRGSHAIAEIRPARRRTGADLRAALADVPAPDDRFAKDIAGALALLTTALLTTALLTTDLLTTDLLTTEGNDPWADA